VSKDTVLELRRLADKMAGTTAVIVFNSTLRDAADEIERLRVQSLSTQRRSQDQDAIMAELWERIHALTDEIERLRRNTGCARNQGTTQFCAEALDAQREVARLTAERDETQRELRKAETESSMLRVECGLIAAERDEARREVCEMLERDAGFSAHRQAASRGWDCFKEDGK
jgi:uncharacterized small protein (DUF1192 family)